MGTKGEFDFDYILQIALGNPPEDLNNNQKETFNGCMDSIIKFCRISNLTEGLDPHGTQTSQQHDSLNHSILYFVLENGYTVRFNMQNRADTPENTEGQGRLTIKFHHYQFSEKEIMSIKRPWSKDVLPSFKHLMIFAHVASIDSFLMSKEKVGCRNFVKGFCKVLIECHAFDLNEANDEFGWLPITVAKHNLNPKQLLDEIARLSLPRLDEYFKYYYTRLGDKRVVEASKARFIQDLRPGNKIMYEYLEKLPELLPKPEIV